jgi:uncharacterized protein (TIGR02996 family)
MDEQAFLRSLIDEPDNDDVRFAYWDWLEKQGGSRAEYVRRMRQRLRLQAELDDIDSHLRAYTPPVADDWLEIAFPLRVRSPMVGRCYTKPAPDAAPFVAPGACVAPNTVLCLIESMKLFNEITAGVHGVVAAVAVANGDRVEYNQVLFRLGRLPDPPDYW